MSCCKSFKSVLGIDIETPNYEILETLDNDVEIRRYKPTKWVSAKMNMNMNKSEVSSDRSKMFRQLFRYITGTNTDKQKIAMTSPVKMDYISNNQKEVVKNSSCEMTMGFYVPQEFNNNTPKPIPENMSIEDVPEMIVAVVQFPGFAGIEDYLEHRDLILKSLGPEKSKDYDSVNLLTAGYDPPFKCCCRKNEVWLRKIK
jgi:hypothetical protein